MIHDDMPPISARVVYKSNLSGTAPPAAYVSTDRHEPVAVCPCGVADDLTFDDQIKAGHMFILAAAGYEREVVPDDGEDRRRKRSRGQLPAQLATSRTVTADAHFFKSMLEKFKIPRLH